RPSPRLNAPPLWGAVGAPLPPVASSHLAAASSKKDAHRLARTTSENLSRARGDFRAFSRPCRYPRWPTTLITSALTRPSSDPRFPDQFARISRHFSRKKANKSLVSIQRVSHAPAHD